MAGMPSGTRDTDPPHWDPLYGANARPAAPGGVPLMLSIGLLVPVMIGALILMHPAPIALIIPAWPLLQWWVGGDYSKPQIVWGWAFGACRTVDQTGWGGSTLSPLPEGSISTGIPRHIHLPEDPRHV
jgi:type IV secretory pathway VirB3-like protein